MNRSSGILMPVFSLPGKYGIGTLGKSAYAFADFLADAGQKYWQILPVGPTSYGDSPYQSFSGNAGNPYFIDPGFLVEDGLLTEEEAATAVASGERIDYGWLYETRFALFAKAARRAYEKEAQEIAAFCDAREWVDGYARFMALKEANGMKALAEWTVHEWSDDMQETYDLFVFIQYAFEKQWTRFKSYVNGLGIKLIGDVPIYVSADSADVWLEPEQFCLDPTGHPLEVSGVPPDYFSENGQLWGNPLYAYDKMEENGFSWWIRRIGRAAELYDVIRVDHFRGFASYWSVPAGEKTAVNGKWIEGPGMKLVGTLTHWFSQIEWIAEDLGQMTPDVGVLLKESGLPGMKVLQFAFDGDPLNPYLPHMHSENAVCYTGTHDNATLREWLDDPKCADEQTAAAAYLGVSRKKDLPEAMLRAGMASVCALFVCPLADWLGLGAEARINTPGTLGGNWDWRVRQDMLTPELATQIRTFTRRYGR